MSLTDFDISRAVQYHYGQFPPHDLDFRRLLIPLTRASAQIARYDATMRSLQNSELLLAPLQRREAVISSRMEGTVATIDEVLQLEAEENVADENGRAYRTEVLEVWSYARAMSHAQNLMKQGLPLSGRLIRQAHRKLLAFGRGAEKEPGEFKSEQNFIVDKNKRQILFIPASPDKFLELFRRYEAFINEEGQEHLLQIALSHIEFEALHPFKDGNGRVGRMIITLMLWSKGLIGAPHFYISDQLEKDKDEYIDRMRAVSERGEWTEWCVFFLEALCRQAEENIDKANQIIALYNEMKIIFREVLSSQWSINALDYVFNKPVFRNSSFTGDSGIPRQTANRISSGLVENGLLRTVTPASGRRSALYSFEPLLQIVRA